VDNAGNVEEPPAKADAVTTVITDAPEQLASDADLLFYPNPASGQINILNRSSRDGCLTVIQTDGKVAFRLQILGQQHTALDVSSVPEGLLQWRWAPGCEAKVQTGRVLVIR
jgi:hypothetical protein